MSSWKEMFGNKSASTPSKKGKSLSCASCGLYGTVNKPQMKAHGKGNKKVLWIGEAPGEEEDKIGKQWQGRVGKYLQKILKRNFDFNLFEDAVCINAINCRPEGNRNPSSHEIDCCRKHVFNAVEEVGPHLIILAGGSAIQSIIGHRYKDGFRAANPFGPFRWRGWTIPDRELNAWVCPIFHPSYVMRSESDMPQAMTIYMEDLKRAFDLIDQPFSWMDEEKEIEILRNEDQTRQALLKMLRDKPERIAFDYETTGLKPHRKGHQIVCAAVSDGNSTYSFNMPPPASKSMHIFQKLLVHPDIGKMAHNIQFEDTWSLIRAGVKVEPWIWDSMQAAHILDNRPKVSSLKFQTCVNFGIYDYASEVGPWLKGCNPKDANSQNKIFDFINKEPRGEEKLLKYCGMDALLEFRLACKQQVMIKYDKDGKK